MENVCLSGLYYRYKRIDDEKIREFLDDVILVKKSQIGHSKKYAYYPLTDESMAKIKEKPRNISLTFDAAETKAEPLQGDFEVYKEIVYLVKSTSRFFLKPDVGEIIDQISFDDRTICANHRDFHVICINDGHELLDETDGEHFLMTATLLKNSEIEKQQAINKLHEL